MILALIMAPVSAWASCFPGLTGGDEPFALQLRTDAKGAIQPLLGAIASRRGVADSRQGAQPSLAHLYAMLMDAYDDSGDIDKAADASRMGLAALTAEDSAGLRRRLQMTGLLIQDERGQIAEAAMQAEAITAQVPDDAPDLFCVLLDRGHLRKRAGRKVDATTDFMRAFGIAQKLGQDNLRIEAGLRLASIYSQYQLYAEAHALENEALQFYEAKSDKDGLGITHLSQGSDYLDQDEFAEAEVQLRKARSYFRALGSLGDEAVAQLLLCETLVRVPHRSDAREACREADYDARSTQYPEGVKLVLGSLGELELRDGNAAAAIGLFDRALGNDNVQITARMRARFQNLRGQARATLHNLAGALDDTNRYVAWLKADHESTEADKVAVLRVRFESALNQQELLKARAEVLASQAKAAREGLLRNTVVVFALLLVGVMALIAVLSRRRVELLQSRRAADERLAALGRLAGGVAHEFNNLLTVMLHALGQLKRLSAIAADPNASALVDELQLSAHASAEITTQLQSFGRQQNLRPKLIDMGIFLTALRPMLQKAAGSLIEIDLSVADTPSPRAWTDERLLGSAILNLVINARDAMAQGGKISIRVARDGERQVRIDVTDSGTGMSQEVLAHAIEPFYSTKELGTGAGLGLSMVNGFVTQSGGSMQIHSQLQSGTTVTLRIPAMRETA